MIGNAMQMYISPFGILIFLSVLKYKDLRGCVEHIFLLSDQADIDIYPRTSPDQNIR